MIPYNRIEYEQFGPEYEKSGFCEITGGYWVTHNQHDFDGVRGDYERNVARILYQNGYKVVLESENRGFGVQSPDGKLNGASFEICSIESAGKNTIKGQLNKCNSKGVDVAIIYFPLPQIYSQSFLLDGYYKYLGIKRSREFKIIFIVDDKIGHIIKKADN